MSEKYIQRIRFLQQFAEFVVHLKNEIRYSRRTLTEIILSHDCQAPLKEYIKRFKSLSGNLPFAAAWQKSFENCKHDINLSVREWSLVDSFGEEAGSGDLTAEINRCDYTLELLKAQIDALEKNRRSKTKMSVTLGAGLSAVIALLLI